MRWLSKFTPLLVIGAVLLMTLSGITSAQSSDAQVRFAHLLPGAGPVDVYVGGLPAAAGLNYGQATLYMSIPAGDNSITVTQTGTTTPIWEQLVSVGTGTASTLIVSSAEPLQFQVFPDDLSPLPVGRTRITATHAIAGGPAVDVILEDGRAVVAGLEYNQVYGTLDIPSLVYPLAVVPAGGSVADAILPVTPFPLDSGTSYNIIVYGTLNDPQVLVLSVSTAPETPGAMLRIAHGVPGAVAVDVLVNDVVIAPALRFGVATEFIAIPAGDYAVRLVSAGTNIDIASADVSVAEGDMITAAALNAGEEVVIQPFIDDTSIVDTSAMGVVVYNGLADTDLSVTLEDNKGTSLGSSILAPSGTVASTSLQPSASGITALAEAGDLSTTAPLAAPVAYGGVYYSALAVNTDDGIALLSLPAVSVAKTLGSAPGTALASSAPTAVAAVPTATVIPMVEPTIAPATPDPNLAVVTAVPPTVAAPPSTTAGPTARVILDPDANLQLRQYPRSDALSLGLAPSGTVLLVNGRPGADAFPIGVATPTLAPEATEYVDPATLLAPDQDFAPNETWLNVTYVTPDGGQIIAWANAQFLDVRDARGRRQRLADLPTIPRNRPGEAVNTAVTPPPVAENIVVATVFNLDPTANLQIRRTPATTGESLALVPNGTVLEAIGPNELRDWMFVRFATPEGGIVTGWVSSNFVQVSFRGSSIELDRLIADGLLRVVPDTERGGVSAGVAAPVGPTQDPLRNTVVGTVVINADANLHLRRRPNANSESLLLIPSGSRIIVSGRTDTSEWVQVEFEGQQGWTSSQYVTLTFNGTPYNLADVPVTLELLLTTTATPSPTATTAP